MTKRGRVGYVSQAIVITLLFTSASPAPMAAEVAPAKAATVDLRAELSARSTEATVARFSFARLGDQRAFAGPDDPLAAPFLDLIAGAVKRHPSVLSVVYQGDAADSLVTQARALVLPQVSAGVEARQRTANRTSDDLLMPRRTYQSADVILNVNQVLYDFGASFERIDAAKARSEAGKHQIAGTGETFALQAVTAYLDMARLRAQVELGAENLARHESIYRYISERVMAGAGSVADLLRVEGRLSEARSRSIALMGELERAGAVYREIFKAEPGAADLPTFRPLLPADADAAVVAAYNANPDLARQKALTSAARSEYGAERDNRWPKVSLDVTGTRLNTINTADPNLYDLTARVRLSYNLFAGGAEEARRRQFFAQFNQAQADEDSLRLGLERAVRYGVSDLSVKTERLKALDLAVQADAASIDAYVEQYTIGRRSLIELLDAQRDQFASLIGMIDSRIELEIARYRLLSLTGELVGLLGIAQITALDRQSRTNPQ